MHGTLSKEARMYARESGGTIELFFYDSHGTARVFWRGEQEAAPMLAPVEAINLGRISPEELAQHARQVTGLDPTYSLQDLLRNADMEGGAIHMPPLQPPASTVLREPLPPVPVDDNLTDATRRRAAKASVRKAVADVMRVTSEQQFKYENAMLVLNKNVDAMADIKLLAAHEGVTVEEWAKRTATEHETRRRRGGQIWLLEARALQEIDNARGDDIEAVARDAVLEIMGEDE